LITSSISSSTFYRDKNDNTNKNDTNNNLLKLLSFIPITINFSSSSIIQNKDKINDDDNDVNSYKNYIMSVHKLNYHPSFEKNIFYNNIGIQNVKIIKNKGNMLIGIIRYCDVLNDHHITIIIRQIQDEAICLHTYGIKMIILIRLDNILCNTNILSSSSLSSSSLSSSKILSLSSSYQKLQQKSLKLLITSLFGYIDLIMIYQNNDNTTQLRNHIDHHQSNQQNNHYLPIISINSITNKLLFSVRKNNHGIYIKYFNYTVL